LGMLISLMLVSCEGRSATDSCMQQASNPANTATPAARIYNPAPNINILIYPTRGVWSDYIYTNEYLGIRFVMPGDWTRRSDEQHRRRLMPRLPKNSMPEAGEELRLRLWSSPGTLNSGFEFVDMTAEVFPEVMIQIIFQRFPNNYTAIDFIEARSESLRRQGFDVNLDFSEKTTIGRYEWYSFEAISNDGDNRIYLRSFINVQNGFVRIIGITYRDYFGGFDEVLSMFIGLDEPVERLRSDVRHPLIGNWGSNVFNADGTGIFTSRNIIWSIDANTLDTRSGNLTRSWKFEIDDDILTLTSLPRDGYIGGGVLIYRRRAENDGKMLEVWECTD